MRSLDIGVFGARGVPSTYSGYETFLSVLLPELAARGHRVTMYCRRGEVPELESYRGVRCVHLPAIATKQLSTLSHGVVAGVRARLAGHDVLLVVNVANALACSFCRALGQPVVLNTDGQEWLRGKWGRVARGIFLGSAHLARWGSGALVSDCRSMQAIYRERFRADSTVIPYCRPDTEPADGRDGRDALDAAGVAPRRYFVIAGRLTPENRMDAIAEAYVRLPLDVPLLVLGAANYRSEVTATLARLESEAPGKVLVGGHVDDRRAFTSLLANALGYIHGHTVGGINPVLVEAMACGARIAAVDTPFNREALAGCGNYFGIDLADLGPVLEAIRDEPAEANQASRDAARERARDQFDLSDVADAYERLLAAAAGRSAWKTARLVTRWEAAASVPSAG